MHSYSVLLFCVAALCLCPTLNNVGAQTPAPNPTLTSLSEIKAVTLEGDAEIPVDFTATVSYADPLWNFVFLQHGEHAIFAIGHHARRMKVGNLVHVCGLLKAGDQSPLVSIGMIEATGQSAAELKPTSVDISSLRFGDFDANYVTLDCKVLQVYLTGNNALIFGKKNDAYLYVNIGEWGVDPQLLAGLVGQQIRATGALGLQLTSAAFASPGDFQNNIMAFKLFCHSMDQIQLISKYSISAKTVKATGIRVLLNDRRREGRFTTHGQITHVGYGDDGHPYFCMRDGDDAMRLEFASAFDINPGALVRVSGERLSSPGSEVRYRADIVQWLGKSELLPAPRKTIRGFLTSHAPNQRVALEGVPSELLISEDGAAAWLTLSDDEAAVQVRLQGQAVRSIESVRPKTISRLRIVGVPEAAERIDSVSAEQIVVSDLSDIKILSTRIPLTKMVVMGTLVSFLLGSLAFISAITWARMLRVTVAEKTEAAVTIAAQLRASYDAAGDGMLAIDASHRVLAVNQEFLRLANCDLNIGEDAKDVIDNVVAQLKNPDQLRNAWRTWSESLPVESSVEAELDVVEPKRVTARFSPIRSVEGKEQIGFLVVLSDQTEKRKLETELLHAGKLEAVGRMVSGVAHDFNNVLSIIASNLAIARIDEDAQLGEVQENILLAEDATFKAADIVRRLLNFSSGNPLALKPHEINAIIEELDEMAGGTFDGGIKFVLDLDDVDPTVMVDRTAIEQVLLNLYLNAKDAMQDGGRLEVKTEVPVDLAANENVVVVSVCDTGTGVPPAIADRIFEPFFTTKGAEHGTGLGLSVSYRTVNEHGGSIFYRPRPTGGSEFRIVLPVRAEEALPATHPPTQLESGTGTILVVDDEDLLRVVAETMLRRYGYQTISASNGDEALDILAEADRDIDAVLLDLAMPGLSGREVFQRISLRYPTIPVIICSGYLLDDYSIQGREVRPKAEIRKPYSLECLITTVNQVVSVAREKGEKIRQILTD